MASVEVIGLLCAGSTRYHHDGCGSSAENRLTRAELAGLLSGLGSVAMNLAFAKYAGDLESERMLIAQVRVWAAGVAVKESWHIVKGRPTLSNMAALAVFESVRPNRCGRCAGRGVVSGRCCSVCNGTGYKALSGRKLADMLEVDQCSYRRIWNSRYEFCLKYIQHIDYIINMYIGCADKKKVVPNALILRYNFPIIAPKPF